MNNYPSFYKSYKEYVNTVQCCRNLKPGDKFTTTDGNPFSKRSIKTNMIVKKIDFIRSSLSLDEIPLIAFYYEDSSARFSSYWNIEYAPKIQSIIKNNTNVSY